MDFHAHSKSQLMVTNAGLITLETDAGVCVVPPRSAAWIEGGMPHRVSCSGAASGYIVFVAAGAARPMAGPCHALAVSPFLSALLERVQALPQRYPVMRHVLLARWRAQLEAESACQEAAGESGAAWSL